MVFVPQLLLTLFTDDLPLLNRAVEISHIVFILFVTAGIAHICPALFQALGYAKHATWMNALHTYILLFAGIVAECAFSRWRRNMVDVPDAGWNHHADHSRADGVFYQAALA